MVASAPAAHRAYFNSKCMCGCCKKCTKTTFISCIVKWKHNRTNGVARICVTFSLAKHHLLQQCTNLSAFEIHVKCRVTRWNISKWRYNFTTKRYCLGKFQKFHEFQILFLESCHRFFFPLWKFTENYTRKDWNVFLLFLAIEGKCTYFKQWIELKYE